jgi:putative hemolysin
MEATIPVGDSNIVLQIGILLLSVLFVAFFSSSEAALISVSKIRLHSLADKGHRRAQAALRVVNSHDKLFATILLTENTFIILASSIGTALALRLLGAGGQYVATLVMTIVLVTFGEITPKTFAAANAERMALIEGRLIEFVMKIMAAPVWLLTRFTNLLVSLLSRRHTHQPPLVTTDELRMLIDIGGKEGAVGEVERTMLQNVFELRDRRANEVMIPRNQIVALEQGQTVREFLEEFAESKHARFPVYKGDLDNIVGFLSVKDVLLAIARSPEVMNSPIKEIMRKPPLVVPESKRISELFAEMRDKQVQIAIILDEYGGTAGLVTLEELVEEIVGQLSDEQVAKRSPIRRVDAHTIRVDAQLRVDEVNEALETSLPESDLYETLAGMIMTRMQKIPEEGDTYEYRGIQFRVTRRAGARLEEIEITLPHTQK